MNKPLTMVIKETKTKLTNVCNESGLSPIHLDLIMQALCSEIHSLVERQTIEEEISYIKMLEKASKKVEAVDNNADSADGINK